MRATLQTLEQFSSILLSNWIAQNCRYAVQILFTGVLTFSSASFVYQLQLIYCNIILSIIEHRNRFLKYHASAHYFKYSCSVKTILAKSDKQKIKKVIGKNRCWPPKNDVIIIYYLSLVVFNRKLLSFSVN